MKRFFVIITFLALAVWTAAGIFETRIPDLVDFTHLLAALFSLLSLIWLCLLRARNFRRPMVYRAFIVLRWSVLLILLTYFVIAMIPRHYPLEPALPVSPDIQYWDLPTGSRIAYDHITGTGNRKTYPVIFLHGGPGGGYGTKEMEEARILAKDGYDVYLYSQIGGGASARLADIAEYSTERHKRDLEAIVRTIGAEKVILVGHSWGAILATLYAADNAGRMAALVLSGPGPIMPMHAGLASIPPPDSLHLQQPYFTNRQGNDEARNIRTEAISFCALHFGRKLASDAEADEFESWLGALLERSTVCDTSLIHTFHARPGAGFYCRLMTVASFGRTKDPRPALHNSPIPLLLLKGQCDNQRWGFAKEYLDLFPRHDLVVIPGAGHSIGREKPGLVPEYILHFLDTALTATTRPSSPSSPPHRSRR